MWLLVLCCQQLSCLWGSFQLTHWSHLCAVKDVLKKTSELAAQGSSLESGKMEGPWKGPDKGFVLSILWLSGIWILVIEGCLQLDYSSLKFIWISVYANSIFAGINTPINFFHNKFKSNFSTATVQEVTLIIITLKVQKNELKNQRSENPSEIFSDFLAWVFMRL